MRIIQPLFLLCSLVLITISVIFIPSQADAGYKLKLKNGKTIKTPAYRDDDNMVQYEMYGAFISIKKSSIASIEEDTSPTQVKSSVPAGSTGNIKIPIYYEVTGTSCRNAFNGTYEADSEDSSEELPLYKNISGAPLNRISYRCFYRQKDMCAWVIGQDRSRQIYYANFSAAKEPVPVFNNLWANLWGDRSYPDISVQRISPPATVHLGRVNYKSKNFPNDACNGIFKPVSIKNGYVKYKIDNNETELKFSAVKNGWQILFREKIAYKAKVYQPGKFPETVQLWEDVNRRPISGKVELLKYQ